ncbi:hypothetical protein ACFWXB_02600 [Tsukamurella tyrosinosolvens]|uniref:hypothetical protein n=1 Tax=Tsukamurella tyrosinosolvens TaxID=57704 RepID=UPI001AFC2125|nr:hypothetical protein [Tsukamurella tyrosinosolvens]QRY85372.1 hypothetical protein JVY00_04590 [Tsukamurella tyrosinosolvens]
MTRTVRMGRGLDDRTVMVRAQRARTADTTVWPAGACGRRSAAGVASACAPPAAS